MKKRTRCLAAVMLAGIMALSLTACGGKESSTTGSAAKSSEKTEQKTEDSSGTKPSEGGVIAPKNGDTYSVGFASYSLVYDSWTQLEATVAQNCKDLGWNYYSTDANGDVTQMVADIEDMAAQNLDFIFVNCADPEAICSTVDSVVAQGIPVIAFDNKINTQSLLTTIIPDNRENGRLCGEWAASKIQGTEINAIIISGVKGEQICQDRRQGVIEGITEAKLISDGACDFNIVYQMYTDWFEDETVSQLEDFLARGIDFNLIITEADVMGLPAYQLLVDNGLQDKVIVCSTADAEVRAVELIQDCDTYCTGLNSFVRQGNLAIETAQAYFNGETKFMSETFVEGGCITKENAAEYINSGVLLES